MIPLTPKQLRLLEILKQYKEQYNYMPTHEELAEILEIKPGAPTAFLINQLKKKGYIKITKRKARAIEIL